MTADYAIGAFNVNNMEIVQGITEAAGELNSPLILQVSAGARKYANHTYLVKLVEAALIENDIPIALHLDHGADFDICKSCIDGGFTSVMIDGSHHPFDENIELTRRVVEYAHSKGVVVEGELGQLAGVEDDVNVSAEDAKYTHPDEVEEFVDRTGVDSLGYRHRNQPRRIQIQTGPETRCFGSIFWKRLPNVSPNFPIVLHGASSVSQEYVKIIQENGGNLADAIGIPEDMLRQAARSAVCKINIDSDLRLAMTAGVRQVLWNNPAVFDPRERISESWTC